MKKILMRLFDQEYLSHAEAKTALTNLTNGNTNPLQVAAFLTVFSMRDITHSELSGFREGMMELGLKIDLSQYDPIDVCGTGGDNKNTFNISTIVSFILAGAGIPVCKHGNYAVSSSCGSSNILEHFGYHFSSDPDKLKADIENTGICFLHAPLFYSSLKNISTIRKDLQFKTFFNMLGPLINPATPNKQVLGVYSNKVADLYAEILKRGKSNYTIIYSLDGYDEISLTGPYRIINNNADEIRNPADEGYEKVTPQALLGHPDMINAGKQFLTILKGEGTREQTNVLIANASMAIRCNFSNISTEEAIAISRESLLSRRALHAFYKLMN